MKKTNLQKAVLDLRDKIWSAYSEKNYGEINEMISEALADKAVATAVMNVVAERICSELLEAELDKAKEEKRELERFAYAVHMAGCNFAIMHPKKAIRLFELRKRFPATHKYETPLATTIKVRHV